MRIARTPRPCLPLALAFVVGACGPSPSPAPPPPPPAPLPTPPPLATTTVDADAGAPASDEDALEAAYRSWFESGLTPATLEAFRRIVASASSKAGEPWVTSGALSDDGSLVVATPPKGDFSYLADAKTGALKRHLPTTLWLTSATGELAEPAFFKGTHLYATWGGGDLVIHDFDAKDAKKTALRIRPMDPSGGCTPAQGSTRVVYATGDREKPPASVHVWDATTRTEVDTFQIDEVLGDRCLRLVTPSIVGIAWGTGSSSRPRTFRLRDIDRKKDLATLTGGARGPVTEITPDGRSIVIAQRLSVMGEPTTPPAKVFVVDAATGATVASSSTCAAPSSIAIDGKGQTVAIGDLRDVCLMSLPKLALVRRTKPLRPVMTSEEVKRVGAPGIGEIVFFGDDGLLAFTEDGKYAAYKVSSGELAYKGESSTFKWMIEGSGPSAVAHQYEYDAERSVYKKHVRVSTKLAITEDKPPANPNPTPIASALNSALARVAARTCRVAWNLFPREACPDLKTP